MDSKMVGNFSKSITMASGKENLFISRLIRFRDHQEQLRLWTDSAVASESQERCSLYDL